MLAKSCRIVLSIAVAVLVISFLTATAEAHGRRPVVATQFSIGPFGGVRARPVRAHGFVPQSHGFVPAGFVPAGFVPAGFVPAGVTYQSYSSGILVLP
jgi:hypothetical protein